MEQGHIPSIKDIVNHVIKKVWALLRIYKTPEVWNEKRTLNNIEEKETFKDRQVKQIQGILDEGALIQKTTPICKVLVLIKIF